MKALSIYKQLPVFGKVLVLATAGQILASVVTAVWLVA